MVQIQLTLRNGNLMTIERDANVTLMEAIRDAGADELLALCGGCCSCATCHVHIDDSFAERLPAIDPDESDLLDSSEHRNRASRLACQVRLTPDLDGMKVTIAADD